MIQILNLLGTIGTNWVQLFCGVSDPYGAVRANISPAPQTDKRIADDRKRYKFWNIIVQLEYDYIVSLPTPTADLQGWRNGPNIERLICDKKGYIHF